MLLIVFIVSIGATYAFFSYSKTDDKIIAGNVVGMSATVTVERVVGSDNQMVPMSYKALSNAITVNGGNSICVDKNGNLSCQPSCTLVQDG